MPIFPEGLPPPSEPFDLAATMARIDGFATRQYWDGQMIGDEGAITRHKEGGDALSRAVAIAALARYVSEGRPEPPLMLGDPYVSGQQFDATEHEPGTLLWVNREALMGKVGNPPRLAAPEPIVTTPAPSDSLMMLAGLNWGYQSEGSWRMVSQTNRGRVCLYGMRARSIVLNDKGKPEIRDGAFWQEPPTFEVGKVYHEIHGTDEILLRTLRVYRCTAPEGQARPRWPFNGLLGALRRLATGRAN